MTILETILESKRAEVAAIDLAALPSPPGPVRSFSASLRARGPVALIAEIKRRSPSRPLIRADFDPAAMAQEYAGGGAAALSVLTDGPFFGGALADLAEARRHVSLPLLRKDFLVDERQILEARAFGADVVLLIVSALPGERLPEMLAESRRLGLEALIEIHDESELERALAAGASILGINNRDLATFRTELATTRRLVAQLERLVGVDDRPLIVSESGISTPEDRLELASMGVDAMLVGEALLVQPDLSEAARQLLA